MPFASGSSHGLRYIAEDTWGTTPSPNPAMVSLRHTSCAVALTKDGFQSNELRSDRQITDFRHGVKRVQGDIGIELSYGEYDPFLEGALFGTWTDNVLKAGKVRKSYTLERAFTDITQFGVFTGCMVNSFSLSIPANAMVTGSIGFIGKSASYSGAALKAEPAASQTNSPFDSFTGEIKEGGTEAGDKIGTVTSIDISIENGLDPAFVVGSDVAAELPHGRSNITGSLSCYFENLTMLNKFIDETESEITLKLGGATLSYSIFLPRIKYTGGDNPASGEGPLMLSMPFQALYDDTATTALQITRFPAT